MGTVTNEQRITKQSLKLESGEFDIESIHTLQLRNKGLTELGCLGDCSALERLNLSANRIVSINAIASLANLVYLDLSCNQIALLDGLQSLEALMILNLAGNLVGSLETLRTGLKGLGQLADLRLVDDILHLTNPVCQNPLYRAAVLSTVPSLSRLDGASVNGSGSGLTDQCLILDSLIAQFHETVEGRDIDLTAALNLNKPATDSHDSLIRVQAAEQSFLGAKAECERVLQEGSAGL